MRIYLFVLAATELYTFILYTRLKGKRGCYLFLTFFTMWFFMAFRNVSVGSDTYMGRLIFESEKRKSFWELTPLYPGWSILCKFTNLFGGKYIVFQMLISGIIILGCAVFIASFADDVTFSSYLFVTTYTYCAAFNTMRQMCAMAFFLLGAVTAAKKKTIPTILLGLVACTIHATVIATIPALAFLLMRDISPKEQKKLCTVVLIGALALDVLYMPTLTIFARYFSHYEIYLQEDTVSAGRTKIVQFVYLFYLWAGVRFGKKRTALQDKFLTLSFATIAIGIVVAMNPLLMRVNTYYQFILLCTIPNLIRNMTVSNRDKVLITLGTKLVFLIPYIIQLSANYSGVSPYLFYS